MRGRFVAGGRIICLAMVCLARSVNTQDLSPDVLKVAHALNTNRDLPKNLKLYTCLETIERSRSSSEKHAKIRDAIQLDVGVGQGREMYSWPGDSSFSSMDLGELVGHGLLATGVFSGFARDLFIARNGVVRVAGEETIQGHRALQFSFQTSSFASQWQVRWNGRAGQVGEAGLFWVDPDNLHLLRLKVTAKDIPPELLLQSFSLVVNYQTVSQNLVPSDASLDAVESGGTSFHNAVEFSHCHIFEADSKVLTSSEDGMAAVLNSYKQQQATLPSGLSLHVELDEAVDKNAMVGNSVKAHLESAIAAPQGLLIPKGTPLRGRIRRFELADSPPHAYLVGIEFSELEYADHDYRFLAALESIDMVPGINALGIRTRAGPVSVGLNSRRSIESSAPVGSDGGGLEGAGIPGAAVFLLTDAQSIPKGFRMNWKTRQMSR